MAQKAKKKQKTKTITVRRLSDMRVRASGFVPLGANAREFAVVKGVQTMFDIKLLEAAQAEITGIVNVLKAGQPDPQAQEALSDKIQLVIGNVAKAGGFSIEDTPVPPVFAQELGALVSILKNVDKEARARDLTLGDMTAAVVEKAEALAAQVAQQATDPAPAPTATPAVAPTVAVADSTPAPVIDPAPVAAVAPVQTPALSAAPAAVAPAPAPATQPAETPVADDAQNVTKGELKAMFTDMVAQLKSEIQVVKAAAPSFRLVPPSTAHVETVVDPAAQQAAQREADFGSTISDLDSMDLTRRVTGGKRQY